MVIIYIVLELAFILLNSYIGKCRGAPTFPLNPCFEDSVLPSSKCVSFIAQCRNWTLNETRSNFVIASQLLKEYRFPLYSNGNGLLSRAVACLAVPNLMPDDGACAECGRYCVNKMLTEKKFCSLYCPLPPPSPPSPPWFRRSLATASVFTHTLTVQSKVKSAITKAHETSSKMSLNNYTHVLQKGPDELFNTTRYSYNHISRGIATATAQPERKEETIFVNLLHTNLLLYKIILICVVIVCACVGVKWIIYGLKQCHSYQSYALKL